MKLFRNSSEQWRYENESTQRALVSQREPLRWLSNTYDPSKPDAPTYVMRMVDQSSADAWQSYLDWLHGKTIGEPRATEYFSVAELKTMGMVGVYVDEKGESDVP